MKKLIFPLLFLCQLAMSQNVVIQGPPSNRIFSSYGNPSNGNQNPGDLWIGVVNGTANFWQNHNGNWYRFLTTLDAVSGPTGATGPSGSAGATGPTGPTGTSASAWSLTGNAGTDPSVNFLGTTDNTALFIDVNSHPLFRIYPTGAPIGYPGIELLDYGRHDIAQFLSKGFSAIGDINGAYNGTVISTIDTVSQISLTADSTVINGEIKIVDGTQGNGKVLTSDANGNASWNVSAFTQSDSATIYATTPTAGTTYLCTNCSGNGVTQRVVTYYGSAWRREPVTVGVLVTP